MGHTKIHGGKRIHIIMDEDTVKALDWLSGQKYRYNRSQAVRDLISSAVDQLQKQGSKASRARSRTR